MNNKLTYIKKTEENRLTIFSDIDATSPREHDCLGLFITRGREHNSPDCDEYGYMNAIEDAFEENNNTEDFLKSVENKIKKMSDEKIKVFQPITRHTHGDTYYRQGIGYGFDDSFCGFYIVFEDEETKK